MNIRTTQDIDWTTEVLVLGLFEEDNDNYKTFHPELGKEIEEALERKILKKDFGEKYITKLEHSCKRIVILSLGKKDEMTLEKIRRVMHKAVNYTKKRKLKSFSTNIIQLCSPLFPANDLGRVLAEGIFLSNYKFKKYITKEDNGIDLEEISLVWTQEDTNFLKGIDEGTIIANSTNFARNLVNEPAMFATPVHLEEVAKEMAIKHNLKVTVLEEDLLHQEGLNALLAVSQGSDHPARLILLEYNGEMEGPWTAIVGKGITFDSGGLSLKPSNSMINMKTDMGGAAAVLATMKALAELGVNKKVVGVVPTCENAIGSSSYRLGDVLTSYNKKTIEITNTDAEGRLILADALSYAEEKYNPEVIIDLATLTGACSVALGWEYSGLICSDNNLRNDIVKAGEESYDRAWPLPFPEEYQDTMKGHIADLKNSRKERTAGAITAAVFLSKFVNGSKWAHLDIAGPTNLNDGESRDYLHKGASGAGTRILIYYLKK